MFEIGESVVSRITDQGGQRSREKRKASPGYSHFFAAELLKGEEKKNRITH